MTMHYVTLKCPDPRAQALSLQRAPKFMRFVFRTAPAGFDALDQLDDIPDADESVIVGVLAETGSTHIDCVVNRKRVGKWYRTARYVVHPIQPDDATVRDTEKWRAWCVAEEAKYRTVTP